MNMKLKYVLFIALLIVLFTEFVTMTGLDPANSFICVDDDEFK